MHFTVIVTASPLGISHGSVLHGVTSTDFTMPSNKQSNNDNCNNIHNNICNNQTKTGKKVTIIIATKY